MSDNKNIMVFQDFARKAKERIEARKHLATGKFYVEDADVTVTLHGLTEEELQECTGMFGNDLENDKYTLYMACPELQETAKEMASEGIFKENEMYKVADMFSLADRTALVKEVLTLSGLNRKSTVKPVSEVEVAKN